MKISRPAYEAMAAHAVREFPKECCGVLMARRASPNAVDLREIPLAPRRPTPGGRLEGWVMGKSALRDASLLSASGKAIKILPAANAEGERPGDRYILDHRTHLAALDLENSGDWVIAGYYHSHPGGEPVPSEIDRRRALAGVRYVILSVNPEAKAPEKTLRAGSWRCEEDGLLLFEPLEILHD